MCSSFLDTSLPADQVSRLLDQALISLLYCWHLASHVSNGHVPNSPNIVHGAIAGMIFCHFLKEERLGTDFVSPPLLSANTAGPQRLWWPGVHARGMNDATPLTSV